MNEIPATLNKRICMEIIVPKTLAGERMMHKPTKQFCLVDGVEDAPIMEDVRYYIKLVSGEEVVCGRADLRHLEDGEQLPAFDALPDHVPNVKIERSDFKALLKTNDALLGNELVRIRKAAFGGRIEWDSFKISKSLKAITFRLLFEDRTVAYLSFVPAYPGSD